MKAEDLINNCSLSNIEVNDDQTVVFTEISLTAINMARMKGKQSPWIDINDRSVTMPDDKMCLLRLEDGTIVRDTEEWEDVYQLLVTHWMEIPSFDGIIESNKDVLRRIKEKGD